MGRSRGGLTTKIHALVDACGLPILLKITEGQAHDGRSAQDMLGSLGRGDVLLGDRGYDSDALRIELAARGAYANVKLMPNRVNLPPFNKRLYRERNLVERFFNKLKHFRAVATRYDKRDDNYLASIKLASARIVSLIPSGTRIAALSQAKVFRFREFLFLAQAAEPEHPRRVRCDAGSLSDPPRAVRENVEENRGGTASAVASQDAPGNVTLAEQGSSDLVQYTIPFCKACLSGARAFLRF